MGRRNRDKEFWTPTISNEATFMQYFNRLCEISMSVFEWKNLPDSVDPRFMEMSLNSDGHAVFFKDDVMGFLCMRAALGGRWDVYNVPMRRYAYASNGYHETLHKYNSVIIWNNLKRTNSMLDIEMFASRLYDIDRSIDVNARAQKTPVLVTCEENQRLTLENVYNQMNGNAPAIFGSTGLNKEAISCLSTQAPFVADKLYKLKVDIWNEALTYLGIANVQTQKKERMVTEEVQRGMGGVFASRFGRLQARRTACEEINKMFGLDISVDFRDNDDDQTTVQGEEVSPDE